MGSIFGGSKSNQNSQSYNKAYGTIDSAFSPIAQGLSGTYDSISKLLSGDASGFNAYKNATGFDATTKLGSQGITGNSAASGLLRSGSTSKALQSYGDTMQNQYANSYLQNLLGQAGLSINAGNTLTAAGNTSSSTGSSSSKPGLTGLIGALASGAAASDRRLKTNINEVGSLPNGLKLYQYRYVDGSGPYIGVMADEVEQIQPEALGPEINGYKTVNYDVIRQEV